MRLALALLLALSILFVGCGENPPPPSVAQIEATINTIVKKNYPNSALEMTDSKVLFYEQDICAIVVEFNCTNCVVFANTPIRPGKVIGSIGFDPFDKKWKVSSVAIRDGNNKSYMLDSRDFKEITF